jgi:hypothetical protein
MIKVGSIVTLVRPNVLFAEQWMWESRWKHQSQDIPDVETVLGLILSVKSSLTCREYRVMTAWGVLTTEQKDLALPRSAA